MGWAPHPNMGFGDPGGTLTMRATMRGLCAEGFCRGSTRQSCFQTVPNVHNSERETAAGSIPSLWRPVMAPGGLVRPLAASGGLWLHLAASGGLWRTLAASGCVCLCLADSGGFWLRLPVPGGLWRLLAASDGLLKPTGCVWRRLAASDVLWQPLAASWLPGPWSHRRSAHRARAL